ncbi:unnamed protein product, partial [marine sediment metagenome]
MIWQNLNATFLSHLETVNQVLRDSYLNWNIHNEGLNKGREEFRVQTSHKIKKTTKEPDYEFWLP